MECPVIKDQTNKYMDKVIIVNINEQMSFGGHKKVFER